MVLCNSASNVESKAGSRLLHFNGVLSPVKTLKDICFVFLLNTDARVTHLHIYSPEPCGHGYSDRSISWGIANSVFNKVRENPLDTFRISFDLRNCLVCLLKVQRHTPGAGYDTEFLRNILDK